MDFDYRPVWWRRPLKSLCHCEEALKGRRGNLLPDCAYTLQEIATSLRSSQ